MPARARLTSVDVCAGAGGLALGLEAAGFDPVALVENDPKACATLRANRPRWNVLELDLLDFDPEEHRYVYDVDLLSAGLPRVKSNASVKRAEDRYEQELLRATIWLVPGIRPRAVLIENVPELVQSDAYADIRGFVHEELEHLGYRLHWQVLNASGFGIPQDRKQGLLVALRDDLADGFQWPTPDPVPPQTVGEALKTSMASAGWPHAEAWADRACRIAPAIVGGSKNRGGADLGPTGTKRSWAALGVNGGSIGDEPPGPDFPGSRTATRNSSPSSRSRRWPFSRACRPTGSWPAARPRATDSWGMPAHLRWAGLLEQLSQMPCVRDRALSFFDTPPTDTGTGDRPHDEHFACRWSSQETRR